MGPVHSGTKGNGELSPRSVKKGKGKTLSKSGKDKSKQAWSGLLFWNHMQSNTGASVVPSRTPDFLWETESSRKREEGPLYREKKKLPDLLTPGSGWSAKRTQVPSPVAPDEVPSSFKGYTGAVTPLASNSRKIVWKPRDRKLPWPDAEPDHIRRSKAYEEWDGAIAKWRALVEEAGVEHSNLGLQNLPNSQKPYPQVGFGTEY